MFRRLLHFALNVLLLDFLPARLRLPAYALFGVAAGAGFLLLRLSEMPSYLADSSTTCINCHIMRPQYDSWQHSKHREVASCNDCHVPHDSLLKKYAFKAKDGMRHATVFTLRREPQSIRAIDASSKAIQENCLRCHGQLLSNAFMLVDSARRCTDCHHEVPHGKQRSLSSAPNALTPQLKPLLPGEKQ